MPCDSPKIAIIGSGCRFPGHASSPSKLWELLKKPRDVAGSLTNIKGFYHQDGQYHGHTNVKEAYLLAEEDAHQLFDASFFGMNTMEAHVLDPQVRILLETVYEALESAGQTLDDVRGTDTAVYSGQMVADYEQVMVRDIDLIGTYHATGTSRAQMSNRISYFFDWHGPSMTIDTACSSSLVALHHAVQQLQLGHSSMAVVTGANLLIDAQCFVAESKLQMLSPGGRSRMWDRDANGYARGEGVAAIVLKRLDDATLNGDNIESVVRGTALNQDGRTPGITMPSATAQCQLIADCYSRAGLDINDPAQRPQFFEAHGTGTLAGDPVEAEAICSSFFPRDEDLHDVGKLYVGSIKTVIGHTEGTAGLAGILKASSVVQHGIIPPNLLFENLNPSIKPFYKHLEIPVQASPWPRAIADTIRRVSVNSFGFGGANAHAIIENFTSEPYLGSRPTMSFTPFVFSAACERSLVSHITEFCQYLRGHESINLRDLAYTLHTRRTQFQVRAAVAACSVDDLRTKLEAKLNEVQSSPGRQLGAKYSRNASEAAKGPKLLGIFTGQGAQWAQMGMEIIESSTAAAQVLIDLDSRLSKLPEPPTWSLVEELRRDPASSRINEAAISQPICTTIQILQVTMLREAGISFHSVIGHSSGEIAAAYAAGYITAENAICIAYYRGLYASLAEGPQREKGAMMAVGTSLEDAQELCDVDELLGRAYVAAVNSPSSVTVSGNRDAVEEMKIIFEDEEKFVRLLEVDTAYHSHHMQPCARAYLDSLVSLDIQVAKDSGVKWFSSVKPNDGTGVVLDLASLKAEYWCDNMVKPVLYMQAFQDSLKDAESFDAMVELGPHPTLKGPTLQCLEEFPSQLTTPYTSMFRRRTSGIESTAECLGYLWQHLGKGSLRMQEYEQFMSGKLGFRLLKDLPSYAWDHSARYWHESRYARSQRLRPESPSQLLGHLTPDSTVQDMRWRNILRPAEMTWVEGHKLQDSIVFPASGYVVLALEAATAVCQGSSVTLVEVLDVEIHQALVLGAQSVEAIFSVANIVRNELTIEVSFRYHSAIGLSDQDLDLKASGRVRIHLGPSNTNILPAKPPRPPNLVKVKQGAFYETLEELGYQYSDDFFALYDMERKLGTVLGSIRSPRPVSMILHPALLDAAFQTVFLTQAAPGDGYITAISVPKRIRKVTFNYALCAAQAVSNDDLSFQSVSPLTDGTDSTIVGDIAIYPKDTEHAMLQVQGLECIPLSPVTAQDDKEVFSELVWDVAAPDPSSVVISTPDEAGYTDISCVLERMAGYYLRRLVQSVHETHVARTTEPFCNLFNFALHQVSQSRAGNLPFWSTQWENDELADIESASRPFAEVIDVKLLRAMGQELVDIAVGEKLAVQVGMERNLLAEWYTHGLRVGSSTQCLAETVKQIIHRYPAMDILEIGAGTGAATKPILELIGSSFASYWFTDISSGFFESARASFETRSSNFVFKTFDVTRDPDSQDIPSASYDLVIASLVLHATPNLEQTLRNARRLLRPGGRLLMLEISPSAGTFFGIVFGAFPGWWSGAGEGRQLSPNISIGDWDTLLQKTGFSGLTANVGYGSVKTNEPFVVICSEAVDQDIALLREPLCPSQSPIAATSKSLIHDLLLVGGRESKLNSIVRDVAHLLSPQCESIRTVSSFADICNIQVSLSPDTVLLSLADLDCDVFTTLENTAWEALRAALMNVGMIVWVTQGRLAETPSANVITGLLRGALRETQSLKYLSLDFEDPESITPHAIATHLLRYVLSLRLQRKSNFKVTAESEIVVGANGKLMIPRLKANKMMNDRFNSQMRKMMTSVDLHMRDTPSAIVQYDGSRGGLLQQPASTHVPSAHDMQFNTTSSLSSAIRISSYSWLFPVLGKNPTSDEQRVALSATNSSVFDRSEKLSVDVDLSSDTEHLFLTLVVYELIANIMLDGLSDDDHILLYEPEPGLAVIVAGKAKEMNVKASFVTSSRANSGPDWLNLHPYSSDHLIPSTLASNVSVFFDLSTQATPGSFGDSIKSKLPFGCLTKDLQSLFNDRSRAPSKRHSNSILAVLEESVANALRRISSDSHPSIAAASVINVSELSDMRSRPPSMTIIDWTTPGPISIIQQPSVAQIRFSTSKTYWLVGLTGNLGLSLCEWMIRRGARYFVLSSRNPKVDDEWQHDVNSQGATIKISKCDVTDRDGVLALYSDICSTMPPIAGVAYGAMVLRDSPIRDMTLDQLVQVTRPKMEGSLHINSLFQENTLDFFIVFSSATAITGNLGQANYMGANAFLSSLTRQRRRRGLAASIINIGAVFGVGYITRQGEDTNLFSKAAMRPGAHIPTSEHDFHHMFAEAVMCGRPGTTGSTELVTGIRRVSLDENYLPAWIEWPMMAHFVKQPERAASSQGRGGAEIPLRTKLSEAQTLEEVHEMIQVAFTSKFCELFEVNPAELAQQNLAEVHFDELGIDSLLAVEIRAWFVKAVDVNIAVLRILNGASIEDVVKFAADEVFARLSKSVDETPALTDSTGQSTNDDEPAELQTANGINGNPSVRRDDSASTTPDDSSEVNAVRGDLTDAIKTGPVFDRKFRLSIKQRGYWNRWNSCVDKSVLNHAGLARLTGSLRTDALKNAVHILGQQHEALRTCVFEQDNELWQGILKSSKISLGVRTIQDSTEAYEEMKALRRSDFDITRGEGLRFVAMTFSPTEHYIAFCINEMFVDGISLQIIFQELNYYYTHPHTSPMPRYQFSTFSENQYANLASGSYNTEMAFWKSEMTPSPQPFPLLSLSKVSTRPPINIRETIQGVLILDKQTKTKVSEVCRQSRATPFHFYLATLRALVLRYAPHARDIPLFIYNSNRDEHEMMNSIGPFVNTVPVRMAAEPSLRFDELLKCARSKALGSLLHSRVPYGTIMDG
ncbi:hypothetical protein GGR57DRAFT_295646 [Xylariaceae sp. FL1272]|nr:hypothetical protein GGR57DRAFT_295646 [Xylariaceae sp. FL1272]